MKFNIEDILSLSYENKLYDFSDVNNTVVLYGAGMMGRRLIQICRAQGIEPKICDSDINKIGNYICDIKVCDFTEIIKEYNENITIIICSVTFYDEIRNNILKYVPDFCIFPLDYQKLFDGVLFDIDEYKNQFLNNNNISKLYEALYDEVSRMTFENVIKGHLTGEKKYFENIYDPNQYFSDEIIKLSDEEVFIDGGAYNGDTLYKFINETNFKFAKIYSFEPTESSFNQMKFLVEKTYFNDERIKIFKKGLYSKTTTVEFANTEGREYSNKVDENLSNNIKIEVISIDDFITDKVTFIKMDIEGSELEALKGATNIIIKNKPKLAISIYHKFDDIIKIPEYIMGLGLDYKYYIRHHGKNSNETVFYAV